MKYSMTRNESRNIKRDKARQLLGGKCARCFTTENLTFDHINPKTKVFNIATSLDKSWKVILIELKKCQLLCLQCHGKKSAIEDRGGKPLAHGRYSNYQIAKCRCNECKRANADYMKDYRQRIGGGLNG